MRPGASLDGADQGTHQGTRVDAPEEIRAGTHVDDAPHIFHRYDESSARRRRAIWWSLVALAALVVAAVAGGYYYWSQRPDAAPPADTLPPRAATEPAPQPQAEPAIQHPIEAAKSETVLAVAPEPLPALDASDQRLADALAGIVDRGAITEFLNLTGFVRRVVVTVDNLPRKKAAQRLWPVIPTAERFLTTGADDGVYLNPENARRYEPFLRAMEAVDTGKLVALYVHFYPLFQQAYRELGYPQRYFNDRLVEVIDHLLVAPEVDGPIRLAQPWILYEFADPALEARSAGQKTLIRMGAANALRVKAKLREFRRQVAGRAMTQ